MAYLALYREWRPKNFKEMVGQEHVRLTLSNALIRNKVAHAYLFSGPRGTGKTTAAKILAKALNCANRTGAEPCNECESCRSIDQGLALDVLEIDAASNRGIDEIRNLREKVKLASSGGRFKVYIIDEVHMLTPEAFNALLKTLEEPPPSVVFVLATTEAHKVPLTILSRVQRFEFHRISTPEIVQRLREVCSALGREVEEKALQVIASKAEGGMRDALSILDQCLIGEGRIGVEHVYQVLGMVGETYSAELTEALLARDYGKALEKLAQGVALGRDPRQIIRELLDYLRQALLYIAGGQEPLLTADLADKLVFQSKQAGLKRLLSWINVLLKGEGELRFSSNARLAAEMILVQAIYEESAQGSTETAGNIAPSTASTGYTSSTTTTPNTTSIPGTPNTPSTPSIPSTPGTGAEPSGLRVSPDKAEGDGLSFELIKEKWSEVLERVRKRKKSTHAFLLEGKPAGLKGNSLLLTFRKGYSFHRDKFNQPENKDIVEEVLAGIFGTKLTLENLMEDELDLNGRTAESGEKSGEKSGSREKAQLEREADSEDKDIFVQKAKEMFGPELVVVKRGR